MSKAVNRISCTPYLNKIPIGNKIDPDKPFGDLQNLRSIFGSTVMIPDLTPGAPGGCIAFEVEEGDGSENSGRTFNLKGADKLSRMVQMVDNGKGFREVSHGTLAPIG